MTALNVLLICDASGIYDPRLAIVSAIIAIFLAFHASGEFGDPTNQDQLKRGGRNVEHSSRDVADSQIINDRAWSECAAEAFDGTGSPNASWDVSEQR
jgi:hypothetical protein